MGDPPVSERARERPTSIAVITRRPGAGRLPSPLTRLIGRDSEQGEARALLRRDDVRLLTLTGFSGVGKTRLALAAAAAAEHFADGVAWVPLAAITDPGAVLSAIAKGVGVVESGRVALADALPAALREARLLLLLDNLEQVLAAAPLLADVLTACPGPTALVTSRAPLRVLGERVLPVEPLALPDPSSPPSLDRLVGSAAVRLFAERAQAAAPAFALTEETASRVAAICRQLDGLPLAIELAAARVTHLDLPTLSARLERRLLLLTGGARDLPVRQRTVRDTISWSHLLLTPSEQTLFRRLSVFAGGWTLDAAEAVGGDDETGSVLDTLGSLVERSLIR